MSQTERKRALLAQINIVNNLFRTTTYKSKLFLLGFTGKDVLFC